MGGGGGFSAWPQLFVKNYSTLEPRHIFVGNFFSHGRVKIVRSPPYPYRQWTIYHGDLDFLIKDWKHNEILHKNRLIKKKKIEAKSLYFYASI